MTIDRSGPCVQISKSGFLGHTDSANPKIWLIPYTKEFSLTAEQDSRQPVKELFEGFRQFLKNAAPDGLATGAMQAISLISDLTGTKIGSKLYYARSWAGSKPSKFNLNLEFFRGMTKDWDSYTEVYEPITSLMAATVPYQATGLTMTSPNPSSGDVFASYTSNIVTSGLNFIQITATNIIRGLIGDRSFLENSMDTLNTTTDNLVSGVDNIFSNRTWEISYGWFGSGRESTTPTGFKPFYTLKNCIVDSSTMKFNPMLEYSSTKGFYPISGTIDLSISTQMILTSTDFPSVQ